MKRDKITTILWPTPRNIIKKAMQLKSKFGYERKENTHCYFVIMSKSMNNTERKTEILDLRPKEKGNPIFLIYPKFNFLTSVIKISMRAIRNNGYIKADSIFIRTDNSSKIDNPDVYGKEISETYLKDNTIARFGFENITEEGESFLKNNPYITIGAVAGIITAIACLITTVFTILKT